MHNRRQERDALRRKLEAGVSIHMLAPRRIGKTWTINRLAADLRESGWRVVEMDVEGMGAPSEFARGLCRRLEAQIPKSDALITHIRQRFTNLIGGNWGGERLTDALGKLDPIEFAEALIASVDESDQKTAIIIDEIAYFFLAFATENQKEAYAFAYRLRALQQRHRNVRWVLTGSIGLDIIASQYRLEGAFVDFEKFKLDPFTGEQARSFLRDPEIQKQFTCVFDASDEDFEWMFQELGWLAPYYLKLVANEVRPSVVGNEGRRAIATRADFEAAFERLLQPDRQSDFSVWREHVDKNLPEPSRAMAKHIVDALSMTPDGETADTLLAKSTQVQGSATKSQIKDVLNALVNDQLIAKNGDRYAFRSGLVRLYWQEYRA
jgi:hypothetical protein